MDKCIICGKEIYRGKKRVGRGSKLRRAPFAVTCSPNCSRIYCSRPFPVRYHTKRGTIKT